MWTTHSKIKRTHSKINAWGHITSRSSCSLACTLHQVSISTTPPLLQSRGPPSHPSCPDPAHTELPPLARSMPTMHSVQIHVQCSWYKQATSVLHLVQVRTHQFPLVCSGAGHEARPRAGGAGLGRRARGQHLRAHAAGARGTRMLISLAEARAASTYWCVVTRGRACQCP